LSAAHPGHCGPPNPSTQPYSALLRLMLYGLICAAFLLLNRFSVLSASSGEPTSRLVRGHLSGTAAPGSCSCLSRAVSCLLTRMTPVPFRLLLLAGCPAGLAAYQISDNRSLELVMAHGFALLALTPFPWSPPPPLTSPLPLTTPSPPLLLVPAIKLSNNRRSATGAGPSPGPDPISAEGTGAGRLYICRCCLWSCGSAQHAPCVCLSARLYVCVCAGAARADWSPPPAEIVGSGTIYCILYPGARRLQSAGAAPSVGVLV